MEPTNISNEISTLPPEAQKQVIDFIAFLKLRYKQARTSKKAKRKSITDEAFIGMWEDRTDMQDGSKWVRNIRESEWAS